jgi:hypothetical protein
MNQDFRITVGVTNHLKIKRLIGRYGSESFVGLVRLWEYAAQTESKDGSFDNLTSADISMIAGVNDDAFGDNLVDLNLLEFTDKGYRIHNWIKHNPWAAGASKRSEKARIAANKRWDNITKIKQGKSTG